jgi:chlorite dismutase
MHSNGLFHFSGGSHGKWKVLRMQTVTGASLEMVERLDVIAGPLEGSPPGSRWLLRGIVSNERYITRVERAKLEAIQQCVGRPEATCAALIPIRKNSTWWSLAQDERRTIFEERSHHIEIGSKYLPPVARRLHHSRDLGEPFDFLTWFEYAPTCSQKFEELVSELRKTEEWKFIDREIDIRLIRDDA